MKSVRAGLGYRNTAARGVERRFLVDILRNHAKQQKHSRLGMMLLACLVAYIMHLSLPAIVIVSWFVLTALVCVIVLKSSATYLSLKDEEIDVDHWNRLFLAMHGTIGICWASLFALHPAADANGFVSAFGFTGGLVLTGVALLTNKNLKYGVLVASFPLVTILVIRLAAVGTMASIGMAAVLIAACFFFHHVADLMRGFHIDHLCSAAERDQLIMQLEDARSISEEARRRAEDANLAKSRFLATMSHELRTPLNAILGFSEVISNEVMGPLENKHYKEYIGDIHSSGTHLLNLINEILDLSRVEAGRYELNEEACALVDAAEQAHQMIKLAAAEKNINLILQIQPDMPEIWADQRAIRQIILNLLSNALKFTPSGGTVRLKCGWTAGGGQYIAVEDTGPGIAEDEIPIVLTQFGQGSIAIKSAEEGAGLGLPIVQALVQVHDGTFDLKSKLREGTKVIVTFPRKRILEVVPALPHREQGNDPWAASAAGKRRQRVKAPSMETDHPETEATAQL
ncbi:MAG: sensor histidine kinase [Rhizobiaceae bacterium]